MVDSHVFQTLLTLLEIRLPARAKITSSSGLLAQKVALTMESKLPVQHQWSFLFYGLKVDQWVNLHKMKWRMT